MCRLTTAILGGSPAAGRVSASRSTVPRSLPIQESYGRALRTSEALRRAGVAAGTRPRTDRRAGRHRAREAPPGTPAGRAVLRPGRQAGRASGPTRGRRPGRPRHGSARRPRYPTSRKAAQCRPSAPTLQTRPGTASISRVSERPRPATRYGADRIAATARAARSPSRPSRSGLASRANSVAMPRSGSPWTGHRTRRPAHRRSLDAGGRTHRAHDLALERVGRFEIARRARRPSVRMRGACRRACPSSCG